MPRSNTTQLSNVHVYNTLIPYNIIPYKAIQYTTCRDFDYICRYRGLRQIIHNSDQEDRFIALEVVNAFSSNLSIEYHEVRTVEENRLDIIAYDELGSADYAWVIAYFNGIEDGFSCYPGQLLKIPSGGVTALFNTGELLATVSAVSLNLGSE